MRILKAGWAAVLLLLVVPSSTSIFAISATSDAADEPPEFPAVPEFASNELILASSAGWKNLSGHRELQMECPPVDANVVFNPDTDTIVERSGCPFRIIDGADLLGSPSLAVDPTGSGRMAFFSLHGCSTENGPDPWSRAGGDCPQATSGETHTTFTTQDEGRTWKDQPYGRRGFGQMNHGITDRAGNLYIATLFAAQLGTADGERVYDYHFQLSKPNDWNSLSYFGREFQNRAPGNVIEHVHLQLVTPWTVVENQEQHNETQACGCNPHGPSDDSQIGNRTIEKDEEDFDDDLVVAVWHERAYDWRNASTGKSSWIDALWADTSSRSDWQKLPDDQLIGPCRHASNPAAWNGRIYVACSVDAGYDGRRGANIGDVDIWAIDPNGDNGNGTKHLISHARTLADGELKMAMNDDGLMAITSTKMRGVGTESPTPRVQLMFGYYGRHWIDSAGDAGVALHGAWNIPAKEARITAMEFLNDRGTLFMSYMERSLQAQEAPNPNALPGFEASDTLEYHKSVSTWEPCGEGMMAHYDLQIGIVRHPFEEGVVNNVTGAFNDFQDGMKVGPGFDGRERVHFAYGDHGVIQYGTIIGESGSGDCSIPAPPPVFVPPPPVPAALSGASGVGAGLAAMLGAPAAAMFGYLLVAKRRSALAAVTKAK